MIAYLFVALLAYMCGHSHGAKGAGRNILHHATRMGKFVIGDAVVTVESIQHQPGHVPPKPPPSRP